MPEPDQDKASEENGQTEDSEIQAHPAADTGTDADTRAGTEDDTEPVGLDADAERELIVERLVPRTEVAEDAEVVMEAIGVSKVFHSKAGTIKAVNNVSLQLRRGETVGLVGESGSGKSTLARIFLDLISWNDGAVEFRGEAITDMSKQARKAVRRDMQAVFQNATGSLLPHYTALDNVIEPLIIHKIGQPAERKARARELLGKVGIDPDRGNHYPRQFSGGQQQRIAIARALAMDPEILVCDEPTSALDVSVQAQILALFQNLRHELSLTCLFISHNLGVIEKVSDRVAVMRHGWIVELAPTRELFNNPQHPYTRQLLNAVLPVRRESHSFEDALPPAEQEGSELVDLGNGHLVRRSGEADAIAS
ncbi:ATP-binding cassette domain-containing protein [Microlunatus sp. Y2014]|uniref:ATP-binding cassette domain-containing protein n=1 Tax=Microlunatus sp. Y2014 TaxID=3418488 RepID=UPI003DA754DF